MMNRSLFNLKTDKSQLSSANQGISRSSYDKISATRDISDKTFDNSSISYKFSIAGTRWWIPSRSYLNIRVRVANGDKTGPLDDATLAPGAAACLFQGAELRLNGKTVSHIPDNLPQIYAENMRTQKSQAWLNTVGRSTNKWFNNVDAISDNILLRHDSQYQELIFTPPLGIFNIETALPSGDYELILLPNPSAQYKVAAIESLDAANTINIGTTAADASFEIQNMFFYCAMVEANRSDNKTFLIDLEETGIVSRNLKNVGGVTNHFEISPSTHAITIAAQSQLAGRNTQFSPTKFITDSRADKFLKGFRLNYANQTLQSPDYSGDVDNMVQLYNSNNIATGAHFDTGGTEDFETFRDSYGPYSYNSIHRDGMDRSTRLEVYTDYSLPSQGTAAGLVNANDFQAAMEATNLLVFYHYRRTATVTIADGKVTNIDIMDA